jgi:23S rRNA pseudouridine1911/1915/1917 synthase
LSYKKKKFFIQRKIKAFKFLMQEFGLSMRDSQRWIDKKRLIVDGKILSKKSAEIDGEIEVIVFETTTRDLFPIFETRDFAIYDKPSGVLVHPATRFTEYSLTHELKHRYGNEANITHRIDKETSGVVIVSKHKEAEKIIKVLFEEKKVKKTYLAYVKGKVNTRFIIDAPILKNSDFDEIKLKCIIDPRGKASQTIIEPLEYNRKKDISLIRAIPLTGRQHQIRVHLFHGKHPIIGDPIYGVDVKVADDYLNAKLDLKDRIKFTGASRLMLHANSVEFNYKNHFMISSKDKLNLFSHQI